MINKKIVHGFIPALLFLLCSPGAGAQGLLSIEDAIRIALENNYAIQISKNTAAIYERNAKGAIGNVLPTIKGDLNTNKSIQNTQLTQQSGNRVDVDGAENTSLNYGVNLDWKIFDGFEMFANYERLKEFQKLGDVEAKLTVQTTLANVIAGYYEIVRLQNQLDASKTALEISQIRLKDAQNKFEIGRASKLDVLAANVDLNADTTSMIRLEDLLKTNKVYLNELLARDVNTLFEVGDTIVVDRSLTLNQLQESMNKNNPDLQSAVINKRLTELNLKAVRANRYPDISLNTGYNFANSTSETGFARELKAQGLNYGLTASIPLFNGFYQNRNEKNAKIEVENSNYVMRQVQNQIQSKLVSDYQIYTSNLKLLELERHNLDLAKENLDISLEKYRVGNITPLELREAQRNYVDANARLVNARFEAKLAEIRLKELGGILTPSI